MHLLDSKKFIYGFLFFTALLSAFIYLWATQLNGVGLRTDSVAYLWAADNLSNGLGLVTFDGFGAVRPVTHWPPLYPVLIAGFNFLFGVPGEVSIRWLGAIFTALTFFFFGLVLYRLSNASFVHTLLGVVLLIFSPIFWQSYLYAMSEPLFVVLSLLAIGSFYEYLQEKQQQKIIWVGIWLGLSVLARYSGLYLIAAVGVVVLFQSKVSLVNKIRHSVIFGFLSVFPFVLWSTRNYLFTNTATNRASSYVPISSDEIQKIISQMSIWFASILKYGKLPVVWLIFAVFLGVILAAIIWRWYKKQQAIRNNDVFLLFLFVGLFLYTASIVFARLMFDDAIPLHEPRIFLPAYLYLMLILIYILARIADVTKILLHRFAEPFSLSLMLFIAAILLWGNVQTTLGDISASRYNGFGLNSIAFKSDKMHDFLNDFNAQDVIYLTDNVEKLYLAIRKPSNILFGSLDYTEIEKIQDDYSVVVVLFRGIRPDDHLQDSQSSTRVLFDGEGGSVIFFPGHE